MARRPADYTAQLQADQQRRRQKLHDRRARALGSVVLEVAALRFDIDQLAGLVLEAVERADAGHTLMEV